MRCVKCGGNTMNQVEGAPVCLYCTGERHRVPNPAVREVEFSASLLDGSVIARWRFYLLASDVRDEEEVLEQERQKFKQYVADGLVYNTTIKESDKDV